MNIFIITQSPISFCFYDEATMPILSAANLLKTWNLRFRSVLIVLPFVASMSVCSPTTALELAGYHLGMPLSEALEHAVRSGSFLKPVADIPGKFTVGDEDLFEPLGETSISFCDDKISSVMITELGPISQWQKLKIQNTSLYGPPIVDGSYEFMETLIWRNPGFVTFIQWLELPSGDDLAIYSGISRTFPIVC